MPIDIKYFDVGTSIGYWDFIREVPLFKVVDKINGKNWKERLEEEYEKIDYLKHLSQQNIIFDKLERNTGNEKIFHCEGHFPSGKKISFNIRLPIRYPHTIPIAEKFYIESWYTGVGDEAFRAACLGQMINKWRADGRMGIAHFLVMLAHYTAMAAFNVNVPKVNQMKKKKKKKKR